MAAANLAATAAGIDWPGLGARVGTAVQVLVDALARALARVLASIGKVVAVLFVAVADALVLGAAATADAFVIRAPRWRVAGREATRRAAHMARARSAAAGTTLVRAASATGSALATGLGRSARGMNAALSASAEAATEGASVVGRTIVAAARAAIAALVRAVRVAAAAATAGLVRLGEAAKTMLLATGRAAWISISYPPLLVGRSTVALAQATTAAVVGLGRRVASAPARARGALRRRASHLAVCPACGYRLSARASACSICGERMADHRATGAPATAARIGSAMLTAAGRILLIAFYCASLVFLVAAAVILGALAAAR